jgi:hypothetical protein
MSARRRTLAVRHTLAWVLANVAEFDRRHLHSTLRWLFGQRPLQTRTTRPTRRIFTAIPVAAWVAFLTLTWVATPTAYKAPGTNRVCSQPPTALLNDLQWLGVSMLLTLAAWIIASFVFGFRRGLRQAREPRRLVAVSLVHEYSDGTARRRPLGPNVTITSGRSGAMELLEPPSVKEYWP